MLILTRTKGQSILIGDDIKIHVKWVNGVYASVGIEAPRHIPIVRTELFDRAKKKSQETADTCL